MAAITRAPGDAPYSEPSNLARWWRRTTNSRAAYLYLFPAFLVMGFITFYPMAYQVWMSFTDYSITSLNPNSPKYVEPSVIGVQNYTDIFQAVLAKKLPNFDFWNLLAFNLLWTFTQVPIHVALGVLIAVLLNVPGLWFKRVYRAIYILPIVIPTLIVATVWKNMYDTRNGAINQLFASVGGLFGIEKEKFQIRWWDQIDAPFFAGLKFPLGYYALIALAIIAVSYLLIRFKVPYGTPITILLIGFGLAFGVIITQQPLSYYAMLIANIWLGWPFMTIVATGALQSIPVDLYEAASIDGASPRQQFFAITVPLIRPAMVPAAMYGIITTFNLFNFIFMMSAGGPLRKTEIMVTTAYNLVRGNQLYGHAAAFCVIIFFILLGLTLLTNTITKGTERYDDV